MANRIIFSDNGTLNDWTINLANYHQGDETFSFVSAEDFIYIGSDLPFNHLYFKFSTANTNTVNLSLSIWDGNNFENAADLFDETDGFKNDGFITWVPDKNKGWGREDTNVNGAERVTGLGTITIYDKYWIRLGFDSDLSASSIISWVGNLFSNDNDLKVEFPDLMRTNTLLAFETGKTDWEEQHVRAAEIIIDDLIDRRIISSKDQILERRNLSRASVSKVAEIVYSAFGDDGLDNMTRARKEYDKRISKNLFVKDKDNDGIIDKNEKIDYTHGKLLRGPNYRRNRF